MIRTKQGIQLSLQFLLLVILTISFMFFTGSLVAKTLKFDSSEDRAEKAFDRLTEYIQTTKLQYQETELLLAEGVGIIGFSKDASKVTCRDCNDVSDQDDMYRSYRMTRSSEVCSTEKSCMCFCKGLRREKAETGWFDLTCQDIRCHELPDAYEIPSEISLEEVYRDLSERDARVDMSLGASSHFNGGFMYTKYKKLEAVFDEEFDSSELVIEKGKGSKIMFALCPYDGCVLE